MNRSLRSLQSTTTLGGQILLLGVAFIGAGLLAPDIAVAQQYWDGQDTTGTPGVSGGNGIWDGTSTNWTDETGTSNSAWTLGGIAIFSGNPGSVTVNSPQNITGLSFKTNGYLLQGESLNLVGTENTFSVESGMSASIGSVISGSGGLIKAADGTLILTGTNTYTGGTKIADGTLSVSDDENLGAADGALTLDGGTIKVTGTDFVALGTNRNFTMTGNGGGINIDNVNNSFVMSQILGGSGDFRKEGAGALVLTGDSSGFAGATEVQSGKLLVDNKLGGNINVQAQGFLGGNGTIGGDVNVADGGTIAPGGNVGSLSIGGDLTLSSGSSSGFQLGALGKNDFIAVGGNLTLDGTLNLSNAGGANGNAGIGYYRIMSYGGGLTDKGIVLGTTPGGLPGADISVDVEQSGYIDLVVSDGSERYWKGDDSQGGSGTWNGSTDWLRADGTSASFTGGTAIFRNLGNAPASLVTINGSRSAESLQFVTNGYSLVSGTNGALVSSNLFRPMELRALQGVSATIDVPIVSGALGLCGGIEKTGGGSVALGGDNSHCGTTISDGTLSVSSDENLGSANGSLTLNGGVLQVTGTGLTGLSNNRDLTMTGDGGGIDVAAAGNTFTVSQALNGTGAFSKQGAGTLALTGNNTYTGGTTISSGILQLGNGGNSGSVAGDIANNGQLAFNRSNALTFGGAISGSGSVSQIGTGTTTLTGTNTYTGGTTIRDGKLSVSADANLGGTNGSLRLDGGVLQVTGTSYAGLAASRSLTMTSEGGGIDVATAGNIFTVSQALNGTGAFSKQGAGTLALTGNNSYSGGTTISGGTLQLGNGGTSGAVTGNIANNGQLAFNRSNALTFGGVISGNGGVSQIGTGTTTLTRTNTYTGGTTISSGILQLGNGGTSGSILGNIANNGQLAFNRSDTLTFGGAISGSGNISQIGSGTTVVTGDSSTFAGTTDITKGRLRVDSNLGGNVNVAAGGQLDGNGTVGGNVNVADGGSIAPGASVGRLSIGGDLTLGAGSTSEFELSTPGTNTDRGSSINDFIAVGGKLTLDGTLNLSDAGGAGIGYYRIMSYGSMADNGINIGTLPSGLGNEIFTIDTTTGGYVDIVVSNGSEQYWKGDDDAGGTGTWNNDTLWVNADREGPAPFKGNLAIFKNTTGESGGVVTVEGAQKAGGLQFVNNGYSLVAGTGGALVTDNASNPMKLNALMGVTASIDVPITGGAGGCGGITKTGGGTVKLGGANSHCGTTIDDGTLSVSADENLGAANGSLTLNGGLLQVTGTGLTGLSNNRDLTMTGNGGGIDVAAAGNTFTVSQALNGTGAFNKQGAGTLVLTGTNTYTGGTTIRDGKLSVSADANLGAANGSLRLDGGVLQVTGTSYTELAASRSLTMTSEGGGIDVATAGNTFTVSQALNGTGAFSKQGAGTLALTGNNTYSGGTTIGGGILQLGNGGTSGAVAGDIANNGQLAFNRSNTLTFGGAINGSGSVSQIGTGTTVLTGTNTYTGGTTISSGILQLGNGGTLGALNGSTAINGGLLQMGGTNQTQANLSLTGGGVSLVNDRTGDRFNLTSNYQGGQSGQILLDIDLAAESADVITIGGVAMGKMNLRLNNISEVTEPILGSSILLVDIQGSGNNLDVTADGLPTGGVVRYDLVRQPASGGNGYQYVVKSGVDGNAASAVVSGFIAAQNVVASSFFKPSSGLVSAPIDPDKNQFGIAPWMRTNSGMSTIETSGTIRQPDGTLIDTPAKLDSQYIGYQFGFDGGLFNINDTDANINVGVTAGQIFGSSDQKNYENTTDFQSVFYGAYAAFTKGPLFLDLQVRQELTDYTVNVNDEVFQIGGEKVSGTRNSIGGSASYTYARNDWSLIPAVGFTYSMNQTDDLSIPRNILLNQKEGKVRFEDVESMISFGGLTVSKNYFVLDDRLRLSPFITLTAYHDFAGDIDATMTIDQNSANPIVLPVTTKRLQTYGEASIGMNLLSLTGKIGGAERLMVGSVRGDFQFGEDVVGGAVTAQFRMQF